MTFVDDAAPDAHKQVVGEAGFTETPLNLVLEARLP
jgi:hypothetical protein